MYALFDKLGYGGADFSAISRCCGGGWTSWKSVQGQG
jgi:hypothetical protein